MTNDLQIEYLEWMYQLVHDDRYSSTSYLKLFQFLNKIEFTYSIPMDSNREGDGIDLRYRFGYEYSLSETIIKRYLDNHPCSVLEMMVALAIRCEESIMSDPEVGTRTGKWFWGMIENMRLDDMDDRHFNSTKVRTTVQRMLNRQYEADGEGGLFTVRNAQYDLRNVEIWYQMCWYLDDVL